MFSFWCEQRLMNLCMQSLLSTEFTFPFWWQVNIIMYIFKMMLLNYSSSNHSLQNINWKIFMYSLRKEKSRLKTLPLCCLTPSMGAKQCDVKRQIANHAYMQGWFNHQWIYCPSLHVGHCPCENLSSVVLEQTPGQNFTKTLSTDLR